MTDIEIRRGGVADVERAVPLIQEFVDEAIGLYGMALSNDVAMAQIRQFVDDSLVAYEDGKMVGVIAGKTVTFELSQQKIFHEQIWFVTRRHRSFLGPKMLSMMEQALRGEGVEFIIMVHLGSYKPEAVGRFYERLGFKFMEAHYIKKL